MFTGRRGFEMLAMLMIGDGLLALAWPQRHVFIWRRGPRAWRRVADYFQARPGLTAWLGAAEAVAGLWLARRQTQHRALKQEASEPTSPPSRRPE